MPMPSDNLRKAAVLISTLDASCADAILDQIPDEQAARIRNALMSLDAVDPAEQESVVVEFLGKRPARSLPLDGGVELDQGLLSRVTSNPLRDTGRRSPDPVPFQFLHEAEADDLGGVLSREHPRIAAVVMSHLPPQKAADILTTLPAQMRTAVLRRIADLEAADPDVIRDLELELQVRLAGRLGAVRSSGVRAVWEILQAADSGDRRDLLRNLDADDRELASRIARRSTETEDANAAARRVDEPLVETTSAASPAADPSSDPVGDRPIDTMPNPFPDSVGQIGSHATDRAIEPTCSLEFDGLARLGDRDLVVVLRESDPRCVTLALAGAEPAFAGRALALLPAREARGIRRKMLGLRPLLLSDVDAAQRRMAEVAARLVEQGTIGAPTIRRFAAAA
ncbi:MAG: hypothetical protein FJ297_03135 [Planctomycetes bacterium]|nr:hypothetical protein [Planctomycetota bacterium]